MEIKVEVKGALELAKNLRDLGINRIPNYVARSLTMLAERVQDVLIGETKEHLTVRGTWLKKGARFGINRIAATKTDLKATVWSQAPWLVAEETESVRKAMSGNILIPLYAVRKGRTDPKSIPRRYAAAARRGLIKVTNEKGQTILYEHGRTLRRHFLPVFLVKPSAPIPKRVHLLDRGEQEVEKVYRGVMVEMIARAIAEKG